MKLLDDRDTALGLAERTRRNLKFIENARANGADVHKVTQVVLSVLGIVIIPWEQHLKHKRGEYKLEDLHAQGWPRWNVRIGEASSLRDLIMRVRNGTAHGRYRFSSNDQDPKNVTLIVGDGPPGTLKWRAAITAADLKDFCLRFLDVVEDELG